MKKNMDSREFVIILHIHFLASYLSYGRQDCLYHSLLWRLGMGSLSVNSAWGLEEDLPALGVNEEEAFATVGVSQILEMVTNLFTKSSNFNEILEMVTNLFTKSSDFISTVINFKLHHCVPCLQVWKEPKQTQCNKW